MNLHRISLFATAQVLLVMSYKVAAADWAEVSGSLLPAGSNDCATAAAQTGVIFDISNSSFPVAEVDATVNGTEVGQDHVQIAWPKITVYPGLQMGSNVVEIDLYKGSILTIRKQMTVLLTDQAVAAPAAAALIACLPDGPAASTPSVSAPPVPETPLDDSNYPQGTVLYSTPGYSYQNPSVIVVGGYGGSALPFPQRPGYNGVAQQRPPWGNRPTYSQQPVSGSPRMPLRNGQQPAPVGRIPMATGGLAHRPSPPPSSTEHEKVHSR